MYVMWGGCFYNLEICWEGIISLKEGLVMLEV